MRLIYILIITGILAVAMLWLGTFGVVRRRMAALVACVVLLGSGSLLTLAVLPGNSFYGETITSVSLPQGKKLVALTFDDGPYPPYTQKLLAVLEAKQVPATFFIVSNNARQYPEVVRLVAKKGHEIGLHAGEHRDLLKLNRKELAGNIAYGKKTLEDLTGKPVKYMRPPHGFRDWLVTEEVAKAGLRLVNWSVIPRDWTNPGVQVIADRVCKEVIPGAIVLLHDGDAPAQKASRQQTIEAAAIIIDELRKQGYEFVTVGELLNQ